MGGSQGSKIINDVLFKTLINYKIQFKNIDLLIFVEKKNIQ